MNSESELPVPGRYRHYKGREYIVLGTARHSETEEELVVYRTDYGSRSLWVRPRSMFLDSVDVNGRQVPRFEWISPEAADRSAVNDGSAGTNR